MRDHTVRGKKLLLAYPCMITQLCLAVEVLELPGIDEFLKAMRTTDLGLIRDGTNFLDRQHNK